MGTGIKFGITAETGNNIVTDGLVGYWDAAYKKSYVSGSINTYNLASGSLTPTGSMINSPDFIPLGQTTASCWDFDGVDDRIDCGPASVINGILPNDATGSLSCEAWILAEVKSYSYHPWIKNDWFGWGGVYHGFELSGNVAGNGWLYILWKQGDGSAIRGTARHMLSGADVGIWYHIVGTYDGTNSKIYANSTLVNTTAWGGGSGSISYRPSDIVIGGNDFGQNSFWTGCLANAKVYNRALSAGDVLQNYNAQKDRFGY